MDQNLSNYIKENLARGISREEIENTLLQSGWQQLDIDTAFSLLEVPQSPLPQVSHNVQGILPKSNDKSFLNSKKLIALVIILVLAVGGGSYFYFFREKSETPKVNTESSLPITETPLLSESPREEIFREGFYINRDLKFSFEYPTNLIFGEKVIDRKGNLGTLSFYFGDQSLAKSEKVEFLNVSVTKEGGENSTEQFAFLKSSLKLEKKKFGDLSGDLYSNISNGRYWAIFTATLKDIKYGFVLSVLEENDKKYLAEFERLLSVVRVNDARASSLPEYFRDNLALDKRISQPSYIPSPFSITYDKQEGKTQKWSYSMNVTELSSGPNNLNIYVQRVGTKNDLGSRQFTVNLENLLEEKSIHQPVVEKGVAKVEPIEVKGFKGYFINIGQTSENSSGSLIFATDKVVASIDYIDGQVFHKEELLKITESMVHQ